MDPRKKIIKKNKYELNKRNSYPPAGVEQSLVGKLPLDDELIFDLATYKIFRHPVAVNGRVHEAKSISRYLQAGGMCPFTRQPITFVDYLFPLKSSLDKYFSEHKDRCEDYEIAPVMEENRGWIKLYQDKNNPIDMAVQHEQFDALPSDDESDESEEESEDENAPYKITFIEVFLKQRRDLSNACCLPPFSFWARRLNTPVVNVAVNTFMVTEAVALVVGLAYLYNEGSVSTLVSLTGVSAALALFTGAWQATKLDDENLEPLRL